MKLAKIQEPLTLLGLVAILGLVVYRAFSLAFTTDEAFTFNFFVQASWWRVIFLDESVSANNHFALTILLKLFISKISTGEFWLRLPSLISFLGLVFFVKWKRKEINFFMAFLFFAFVFSNHIALDLFSLSRGYGISFCLLIIHFFYLGLFSKQDSGQVQHNFLAILFLFFAVSFNLNLLLYAMAFFIVLFFAAFRNKILSLSNLIDFVKANRIAFLFLLFVFPVVQLIRYKQLYYGGDTGILEDSIYSLFRAGWYTLFEKYPVVFKTTVVWVTLCSVAGLLLDLFYIFRERNPVRGKPFTFIFLLCIVIEFFQHLVFGTPYLLQRSALVYWFLIGGILSGFFCRVYDYGWKGFAGLTSLSLGFLFFFMAFNIPMHFSPIWKEDADNNKILPAIVADAGPTGMPGIDNAWFYEPGLNYYRQQQGFADRMKEFDRQELNSMNESYYVISREYLPKFERNRFTIIRYFPVSETYILRRN